MNLEEKIISEITDKFTIEAYQRGYRWGKDEVEHPDFITFFRHQIAAIDLQLVRYNFWVA